MIYQCSVLSFVWCECQSSAHTFTQPLLPNQYKNGINGAALYVGRLNYMLAKQEQPHVPSLTSLRNFESCYHMDCTFGFWMTYVRSKYKNMLRINS